MIIYYNICHMSKQFKVKNLVKLLIKYLKLKYPKLSPCWTGPFRILKQIDGQTYQIALSNKYTRLHPIFSVQMLENYHHRDNNELTAILIPDFKKFQDEWNMKEVKNK